MPSRKISFVPGEYYHIYNRGNSKQKIFFNKNDYEKFAKYLYVCNTIKNINFRDDVVDAKINAFKFERGDPIVSIGAWVLMPNHFHLYLTSSPSPGLGEEEGKVSENAISKFMSKLGIAYVNYLNKKYKRTGGLFEGPFKAVHVGNDNQAKYLFSYIHLNPVKIIDSGWKENGIKDVNKTIKFLEGYKWSSYQDYSRIERPENKIIKPEDFPFDFGDKKDFDGEIFSWLNYGDDD